MPRVHVCLQYICDPYSSTAALLVYSYGPGRVTRCGFVLSAQISKRCSAACGILLAIIGISPAGADG